jgi:hypothetical protein
MFLALSRHCLCINILSGFCMPSSVVFVHQCSLLAFSVPFHTWLGVFSACSLLAFFGPWLGVFVHVLPSLLVVFLLPSYKLGTAFGKCSLPISPTPMHPFLRGWYALPEAYVHTHVSALWWPKLHAYIIPITRVRVEIYINTKEGTTITSERGQPLYIGQLEVPHSIHNNPQKKATSQQRTNSMCPHPVVLLWITGPSVFIFSY